MGWPKGKKRPKGFGATVSKGLKQCKCSVLALPCRLCRHCAKNRGRGCLCKGDK
jgi:hypothetical protein